MIRGEVNTRREATIPLRFSGPACTLEITLVIDTGFSGFLTLLPDRIAALGLPLQNTANYVLGNGEQVTFRVFGGIVEWDGHWRDVNIVESDGGDLVGTRMLYGSLVTIDMRDGGQVTIQPSED